MKRLGKIAVFVLCALMLFSMVGCNQGNRFEENETPDDVTEISILANDWNQFNNGRRGNSPVYKELKKQLKIDIVAESVGYETYDTTIELRRTDGDLPELFCIDGPVKPKQYSGLIREKEIIAIDDYVNESTKEKYPYLYEYMEEFAFMRSNVEYANGKIWFIPTKWSNEKSLYVRRDWIQNLNNKLAKILVADGVIANESQMTDELKTEYEFKIPETLTEFYRLARAFTVHDPDGNGKSDTRGYMTEKNRDMDSWMYVACDTGWKQWVKDSKTGKYVFSNTTEGAMLATSIFNKMFKEGYISPDAISADVSSKQKSFANGASGMMYAHNWYNVILAEMMGAYNIGKDTAKSRIAIVDTPAGVNGTYGGHGDSNYYRGFCINANMSKARIEKCLEMMDYLRSPEGLELLTYGVEGEHWEIDEDDNQVSLLEEDSNGFLQALRWSDNAGFIIYLAYTPVESELLMTNGELLVERARATAKSQHKSDYPDVYTNSSIQYQGTANDKFDKDTLNMIKNKEIAADWVFDAKTWKNDGWTKLYTVSNSFKTTWNSFVSAYNDTYKGTLMQNDYNTFIQSGKAQKRPGLQ